jgi:RNA polymerase sigma factor (sigma-70 family)
MAQADRFPPGRESIPRLPNHDPEDTALHGDADLLRLAQCYLDQRASSPAAPAPHLERAWARFYERCSRRIHKYAFSSGATEEHIADCVQDVWTELLVRLPAFRLDPARGTFDTWLYNIVRGKTVDLLRFQRRRLPRGNFDMLAAVTDERPGPSQVCEALDTFSSVCAQLKARLSRCNYDILHMRLLEGRPVPEVARCTGLSNRQVWYRYHRARRLMQAILAGLAADGRPSPSGKNAARENLPCPQNPAQGKAVSFVSRNVGPTGRE